MSKNSPASEDKYRSLIENSPIGIAVHRDGVIIYANPEAMMLFGIKSEREFLGMAIAEIVHPDSRPLAFERLVAILKGEKPVPVWQKWVRHDGSIIDVEVTGALIDFQGSQAVQVIFTDITERRIKEKEIRESEELYRGLAESVKDIIWTVDMDLKFTYLNASVEEILGYKIENLLGKGIGEIMSSDSVDLAVSSIKESMELEAAVGMDDYESLPLELQLHHKDGTRIWVEVSRTFLRDDAQKPFGVLGIARDITRRKNTEEELERAVKRAEFYNDLMAHDLSNMLQGIMGSLELILLEEEFPERLGLLADGALKQTQRGVTLIGNVKKLAMVAKQEDELIQKDPYIALSDAIEMVRGSFPEKTITINSDLKENEFIVIANDFLTDLFYNILHNSAKLDSYLAVKIDVNVSKMTDESFLKLAFKDRGPGISEQLKETVFIRYEDRVRRGKGLGLTLVKKIVDRYGGKIWAEDRIEGEQQKGACIVVLLPLAV